MSVSLVFDEESISDLARRIFEARQLYGADSGYVIGMFSALDTLLEDVKDGPETNKLLRSRLLEIEEGGGSAAPPVDDGPQDRDELEENIWVQGQVKWFNNDKGYGFISTDGEVDVFVHWRDISSWDRTISQGEEVEFMVTKTAKGFQAVNVMKTKQKEEPEDSTTVEGESAGQPARNSDPVDGERAVTDEAGSDGDLPTTTPSTSPAEAPSTVTAPSVASHAEAPKPAAANDSVSSESGMYRQPLQSKVSQERVTDDHQAEETSAEDLDQSGDTPSGNDV